MIAHRGGGLHTDNSPHIISGPIALQDGRTVGNIDRSGKLVKHIKPNHILQKPGAIALDTAMWRAAKERGVRCIEISCSDGRTFFATAEIFDRYSMPVNRNFGPQLGLPLGYWQINGKPAEMLVQKEQQEAKESQLGLFGGAL